MQSASSWSRFGVRFAVLGAVAVSASACSSDRFAYDPFGNPFNGRESGPTMTGSVSNGAGPIASAPVGGVTSEPLAAPSGYGSNAPAYAPAAPSYPPYQQQSSAPAQPSYSSSPAPTYSAAPSYPTADRSYEKGGRTVVVQYGDTPYSLGQRHGVPASKILSANKLPQGSTLVPGQRLVIPSTGNQAAANEVISRPAPVAPRSVAQAPASRSTASGGGHTVAPGETLFSIARRNNVPVGQLAAANGFDLDHQVRIGETLTIPAGTTAVAPAPLATQKLAAAEAPLNVPAAKPLAEVKTSAPVEKASEPEAKFQPAVASMEPKPAQKDEEADDAPRSSGASSSADFRWPVRGRVISGFGSKPNGATNDGVNLSVPEGTAIKAAEGGVVAYAGNELKGFGNLVLIRHQGEWVTAYAHASEILVKRGDVVRRGQIIAKSGKTGNVSAPQLHFEVRRGATPVDPMQHLPAG
ncbi:peptidoglycan DD-metalloendopeptidase family protein [Terrihabitans rhizophilus]|nr:peptidoglycan DD-metalloendopeptidase family protein [Terrihabitans sp. PJ23]